MGERMVSFASSSRRCKGLLRCTSICYACFWKAGGTVPQYNYQVSERVQNCPRNTEVCRNHEPMYPTPDIIKFSILLFTDCF